jgi:hypothetical protein
MVRPPLDRMRFRTQGLASPRQATYGRPEEVQRRDLQGQLHGHQGWDLEASDMTYAIEDGVVVDVNFHSLVATEKWRKGLKDAIA